MKRLVCIGLLVATGCASTATLPVEAEAPAAPIIALEDGADGGGGDPPGIQGWIPGFFADLWQVFDANIGTGYGFGMHLHATELARLGIFDYSDFSLLGIDKGIFYGEYTVPPMDQKEEVWVLGAKFGIGFGMEFSADLWEFVDFASSLVGFGYWSFDND
ncbi:MAG: hypothetical protein DHS20C15_24070 [Planctomycetota bacterium]|nr:MAG: hypothetical protein DHS20C15_24070 [Planctomycetota bacterium]